MLSILTAGLGGGCVFVLALGPGPVWGEIEIGTGSEVK